MFYLVRLTDGLWYVARNGYVLDSAHGAHLTQETAQQAMDRAIEIEEQS